MTRPREGTSAMKVSDLPASEATCRARAAECRSKEGIAQDRACTTTGRHHVEPDDRLVAPARRPGVIVELPGSSPSTISASSPSSNAETSAPSCPTRTPHGVIAETRRWPASLRPPPASRP